MRYVGAQHSKVFFVPPVLILGSTNWSVASEANREMSCVLRIPTEEAMKNVKIYLDELAEGALEVTPNQMQGYVTHQKSSSVPGAA